MNIDHSAVSSFRDLALAEPLLNVLDDLGYSSPTPIQTRTIPPLLEGRDMVGQAETGSGKTAAFALPLLARLDLERREPQVLVLTPTRELAIQVSDAIVRYAARMKSVRVLPIYGGQGYGIQLSKLKSGVHVVVGTPGRIMDHIRRGTLTLDGLSALVLDEADEMLHMGFIEDVEWIIERTPKERQVALFSATMPAAIRRIAKRHLNNPEEIISRTRPSAAETISQRYLSINGSGKLNALMRILEVEPFEAMIIFVKLKSATLDLAEKLSAGGYACAPLNGDIPQNQRERTVQRFKEGKLNILVATDVAARGLDVERVSHVLNFDLPRDAESYVHRIGRTGRAGRSGEAISFIGPAERRSLVHIERATHQALASMELPSVDKVNEKRIGRFLQRITDTVAAENLKFFEQLIERYQGEHELSPQVIAAALASMVQGPTPMLLKDDPPPKKRRTTPRTKTLGLPHTRRTESAKVEKGMERFRLAVGSRHGVRPGNIVGAIANEGGLSRRHIGRVKIGMHSSTVDLPIGIPKRILRSLKRAWVCDQRLCITRI